MKKIVLYFFSYIFPPRCIFFGSTVDIIVFHQPELLPVESDDNDVKSTGTMTKIVTSVTEI